MRRVYYGWYVVASALIVYMLLVGVTYSSFGLFVLPVSADFHLSRASMNTGLVLLNIGNAVLAPFFGMILDRYPIKRIMLACSTLFGVSFVTLGLSRSLWLDAFVLAVPLAMTFIGAGTLTMAVLVARWFTAQRGRAMALALMGTSIGNIVVTPVVGLLIVNQGWRPAMSTLGIAITVLLLIACLIVRERPRPGEIEGGQAPAAATPVDLPLTVTPTKPMDVGQLLRMPLFWAIAGGESLTLAMAQTIAITLVPLALGDSLSMLQSTSLMSVMGGASIAGVLLLAVIADKVDRAILLAGIFLLGAVLNLALLFSKDYPTLLGCAVLLGLASSTPAAICYALIADRFGAASFGTVRGLVTTIGAVVNVVVLRLTGEIFDHTGGYSVAFDIFIIAQVVAALLIFGTRFMPGVAAAPRPA